MRSSKKRRISILLFIIAIIFLIYIILLFTNNKKTYKVKEITEYNYFSIVKDEKYGVIDKTGTVIIEPTYYKVEIPNPSRGVFLCVYEYNLETQEYKTKILNEKNEQILTIYNEVDVIHLSNTISKVPLEKNALIYKENNLFGIIDLEGKKITKPIYEEIKSIQYKEGELLVKKDGKYGLINADGKVLIQLKYDNIICDGHYMNGYSEAGYIVQVKDNSIKYGYIDNNYKLKIKPEYNELYRMNDIIDENNIYLLAYKNGQAGIIKNGEIIINCKYTSIEYNILNKLFVVEKNKLFGVLNLEGKEIVPLENDKVVFEGIYITTLKNEKETIYKVNNTSIEKAKYVSLFSTHNSNYYISINDKGEYGVVNDKEEEIIKNQYKYIEYVNDDYFMITADNKYYGIVNAKTGEIKIELKYDYIQKIQNSNIVVGNISNTNLIEIYNKELNKIISANDLNLYWKDNFIKIISLNMLKYIDIDGKEIQSIELYKQNQLLSSVKNGRWGFIDREGNEKIEHKYDMVTEFNDHGFAGIKKDGKWGVIDSFGKVLKEPSYRIDTNMTEPYFIGEYYRQYTEYGEEIYINVEDKNV